MSQAPTDADWMLRAMDLAMKGRGGAEPNPLVGCVIVKNGRVIGEGFHERFGGPHAEPNALAACAAAGESPVGATAYVTLEPCCHTSKKTPPCVPRLIQARLARVVVGCLDPNPAVDGKGVARLRSAGIDVTAPVLGLDARQLIAPFLARVRLKRPYVTLKWAESADGNVAGSGGRPVRITNETSTRAVHELRGRCDAILVGIGTVLADDPLLTPRGVQFPRLPRRVVLDSRLRIPLQSRLVQTAREKSLSVYSAGDIATNEEYANVLLHLGVKVYVAPPDAAGRPSLGYVVQHLDPGLSHLLVEPGPELARSFFREGLADRLWVFRSPMKIEDPTSPAAACVPDHFLKSGELDLGGDHLTEYLNPASEAFFKSVASPDLHLTSETRPSQEPF